MVTDITRNIEDYPHKLQLATRWIDNDAFGHMNNSIHYQFFDTTVNRLIHQWGCLQSPDGEHRFLVIETGCRYYAEIAYPDIITVGLRIGHVGNSSVRYELGMFRNEETFASASGFLVHVNVSQATGRPVPIPDNLRLKMQNYANILVGS